MNVHDYSGLSEEQQKIIDDESPNIFVESCAASGKSRTIVEKIKKEVAANKGQVVAFTFTVAAAEEIQERVGDIPIDNLYIGTIHAYCLQLLTDIGLESEAFDYIDLGDFDGLCYMISEHQELVPDIYCVICDETQDCTAEQLELVCDLLKPQKRFIAFDKRQSIYGWNGARPDLLDYYIKKYNTTIKYLDDNYRNKSEILEFAKNIIRPAGIGYQDYSRAVRGEGGQVIVVDYSPEAIARTLAKRQDFGDWMILVRNNNQFNRIEMALNKYQVPYQFIQSERFQSENETEKDTNCVRLMTIHTAKGLESKNVVVIGARLITLEERRLSYVGATRARDLLVWTTSCRTKGKQLKQSYNWEKN